MKSMGLQLESLIAAYGIRWNIKYISREKAWKARDVGFQVFVLLVKSITDTRLFIRSLISFLRTILPECMLNIASLARTVNPMGTSTS